MAQAQTDSAFLLMPCDTVCNFNYSVDKPCATERQRAINDAHAGKYYFIESAINTPLHLKYMPAICKANNLRYYFMSESRLGFEGFNPFRCYMAAMDSILKLHYGNWYKIQITAKADSCLMANIITDTVNEAYCTPARLSDNNIHVSSKGEFFQAHYDTALYNKFKHVAGPLAVPYMIIQLLIEPDGKVSAYKLISFESEGVIYYKMGRSYSLVYNNCGSQFYNLAKQTLAAYSHWQPALINNVPVRVWHTVQVVFEQ